MFVDEIVDVSVQTLLLLLFVVLALLHLAPICSTRYLPTADGPEHLYNSWILHDLVTGSAQEPIRSYYVIDWRPIPNWTDHAVMAALIAVVPPLIAEKVLFGAILMAFFAGAWVFAGAVDERCNTYAFMAVPFAYHDLLLSGFYNFSLSLAIWMFTIGYWWKRRDRPDFRTILTTGALLIFCYFSHPMATALAIGSIGLMWLVTLRGKSLSIHIRHVAALVPASALLLWYTAQQSGGIFTDRKSLATLVSSLSQIQIISNFDPSDVRRHVLFGLMAGLGIATLIRENVVRDCGRIRVRFREADAFLLLFGCFLGLYLWSPAAFAGGSLLTERMSLFVLLSLLPWYSPRFPVPLGYSIVAILTIFAVFNAGYLTVRYREADRALRRFVETAATVAPNSTLLPVMIDRNAPHSMVGFFSHATGYVAIEKNLVDLDNYEAATGYFPIAWAPGLNPRAVFDIEAKPEEVEVSEYSQRARFVLTWKMPARSPLATRLVLDYRLVSETGDGRIYESKALPLRFDHSDFILLPLAGTDRDVGAAIRWRVDQQIRNGGAKPVRVILNTCPAPPCVFDIAPRQSIRVVSNDPMRPYIIARTERDAAALLQSSTVIRRADPAGGDFHVALPSVRAAEFARGSLRFKGVPLSGGSRLNLRIWAINAGGRAGYSVRIVGSGNEELARRMFATGHDGFVADGDLGGEFPQLAGRDRIVDVIVELDQSPPGARTWGFISVTDNRTNLPRLLFPAK